MTSAKRPAHETPGGYLVRYQDRLWIKAQRDSKDYVNHYLVAAKAAPELALVYIDPEIELEILAERVGLGQPVERTPGEEAQFGDVIVNGEGRSFIKALDVKKSGQRHLAYVDMASGEVRPRQERGPVTVYAAWALIAAKED